MSLLLNSDNKAVGTETSPSATSELSTVQQSWFIPGCIDAVTQTNCKDKRFTSFSLTYMTHFKDLCLSSSRGKQFITSTLCGFKSRDLSKAGKQFSDAARNMTWKFSASSPCAVALLSHPSQPAQNGDTMYEFFAFSEPLMSRRAAPAVPKPPPRLPSYRSLANRTEHLRIALAICNAAASLQVFTSRGFTEPVPTVKITLSTLRRDKNPVILQWMLLLARAEPQIQSCNGMRISCVGSTA